MIFNLIKVKRFFILLMVFVLFCAIVAMAPNALALDTITNLKTTADTGFGNGYTGKQNDPSTIIGKVVGAGLAFIGVLFLILMIYGGFTWMLARGNEQEVTRAKDLIYSAVIGLVIVLAAYAITAYVGGIFKQ